MPSWLDRLAAAESWKLTTLCSSPHAVPTLPAVNSGPKLNIAFHCGAWCEGSRVPVVPLQVVLSPSLLKS
jgi:hypothetical protein